LPIALAQLFATVWLVLYLVLVGIVDQPEFQRIYSRGMGELIHSAFDSEHTFRAAGRSHVARRVVVELDELLRKLDIGAGVEQARPGDVIALEILDLGRHADPFVSEARKLAVTIGGKRERLYVRRAVAKHEHLLARKADLHGTSQRLRREHRQRQLALRTQARSETAADI